MRLIQPIQSLLRCFIQVDLQYFQCAHWFVLQPDRQVTSHPIYKFLWRYRNVSLIVILCTPMYFGDHVGFLFKPALECTFWA